MSTKQEREVKKKVASFQGGIMITKKIEAMAKTKKRTSDDTRPKNAPKGYVAFKEYLTVRRQLAVPHDLFTLGVIMGTWFPFWIDELTCNLEGRPIGSIVSPTRVKALKRVIPHLEKIYKTKFPIKKTLEPEDGSYREVMSALGLVSKVTEPHRPPVQQDLPLEDNNTGDTKMTFKAKATNKKPSVTAQKVATKAKSGDTKKTVDITTTKLTKGGKFRPEQKITLLIKENPRHKGTRAHKTYGLYSTCKTVGEFFKKGGTAGDLRWDTERGNIKVN